MGHSAVQGEYFLFALFLHAQHWGTTCQAVVACKQADLSLCSRRSRTKGFSAFWPRENWSESKKFDELLRQIFALAPIYARPECGKALCAGLLATQASWSHLWVTRASGEEQSDPAGRSLLKRGWRGAKTPLVASPLDFALALTPRACAATWACSQPKAIASDLVFSPFPQWAARPSLFPQTKSVKS